MKPVIERAVEKIRIYTEKRDEMSCEKVTNNVLTIKWIDKPSPIDIKNLKKLVLFSESIDKDFFVINNDEKEVVIDFNYYEEFLSSRDKEQAQSIETPVISTVFNRVQSYIGETGTITFEANELTITFKESPTSDVIENIKEIVFSKSVVIPNLEKLYTFNSETNQLVIKLKNYELFILLLKKLEENNNVIMAYIKDGSLEYSCIHYYTRNLNYTELEELQTLVNPSIPYHDSIRVSYRFGISVISIDLLKTRPHFD